MRSAWASGLHLRSRMDEKRGAGDTVNTFKQNALIHDGYERTWHATPGLCGTQTKGVMEAFLVSAGVVALAEIGDKTQLLALVLAARFGAYGTSVISFFLLEIGDKTQIATVALAAKYHALAAVVAGTTLGMMLADVPVVLLGEAAAKRLSLKWVHGAAAAAFVVLALLVLLGVRL